MNKVAMFVFNGDPMCFIHVLLNALDMKARGYDCRVIIEGAATKLIPVLEEKENPLHQLWQKTIEAEMVHGTCKACTQKMGTLDAAKEKGLALLDDMNGHPSMAGFQEQGYEIITF